MAYSVDWVAGVISIPASDLTLVSGTRYKLVMQDFLKEIRRLEAGFADGLWALQILDHTNPKLDFAGANYAGFDEIINGYTVVFTGAVTRVDLVGSNNNLVDVLVANGVSVVPSNTAGYQLIEGAATLPPEQQALIQEVHNAHYRRRKWDKGTNELVLYEADKVTPDKTFDTNADLSEITPQ